MKELVCIVCGLKIRPNTYSLNNNSFLEKNTEDEIISCPFCGVEKDYLIELGEVYNIDREELDEGTIKILDKAVKLEVFNGEFYEEASKLAKSEDIKNMFKDLSNIELMHARIHKRLGGFKEMPELRKPDYTRHDTDELLLKEANKREKHAIAFYSRFENEVSSDTIVKIFRALSEVERQHMIITD